MTTQFVSLKVTERKLKSKEKKKALGLLLGLFLTLIGMSYESKSEGSDTLAPQEQ